MRFVINLLHGLNPHFSSIVNNIVDSDLLPDFVTTCKKFFKELSH
jgi:hypothetical protein